MSCNIDRCDLCAFLGNECLCHITHRRKDTRRIGSWKKYPVKPTAHLVIFGRGLIILRTTLLVGRALFALVLCQLYAMAG